VKKVYEFNVTSKVFNGTTSLNIDRGKIKEKNFARPHNNSKRIYNDAFF